MGMAYPQYNLDQSVIDLVLNLIEEVKRKNFAGKDLNEISHRPLRPEELNPSLNVTTRTYATTNIDVHDHYILDGTIAPVVKTGSVYVIYGWIVINLVGSELGIGSIANVKVEGVIRNEVCPYMVALQDNSAMLTLDQVVILTEQTTFEVTIRDDAAGAEAIVYPLGVRIGPTTQLSVS